MEAETAFVVCNLAVLSGWALLVLAPRWKPASELICPVLLPALLAAVYAVLIARWLGDPQGGFGSLEAVARVFADRWALLAGWLHYLAFDLFVASWEVRDARRLQIRHALVVPCLLLTLWFGPLGWLSYVVLRASVRGVGRIEE